MTRHEAAREAWRLTQQEGQSLREAAKAISARGYTVSAPTVGRMIRAQKAKRAAGGEVEAGPPADSRGDSAGPTAVSVVAQGSHPELTEPQQIAIRAIMAGSSYTAAAAAAGVSRAGLAKWRHQPQHRAFQQALRTEQDRTWTEHRERLDALRNSALDVLADMLGQPDADPRIALSILDRTGLPASKEVTHRDESSGRDPELAAMSSDELRQRRRARLRLVGGDS